ncbi:MAG: ParB N-terminal domain-containing protein [Bacteroidales bacterium]|jgi:hypothetical protein|nr:ParB N-terminal domain-containing protein [Bacteroidales bacterium]
MNTQLISVNDLIEHPDNPRLITKEKLTLLSESLKEDKDLFNARPIIASNRTGKLIVIAGNQRLKASKINGINEVPVYIMEGLTESDEVRIMLKDNADGFGKFDWATIEMKNWQEILINKPSIGIEIPKKILDATSGGSKPRANVIQNYTILFSSIEEQNLFYDFLTHLRNRFSGVEMVSSRLLLWVEELYQENKQYTDSELILKLIKVSQKDSKKEKAKDYDKFKGEL